MTSTNPDLSTIKSWLEGMSKQAALPEPSDGGKPATTGARAAENSADVKKTVPGINIDAGEKNPETGKVDNPVPDSGLKQTTVGKMPSVEDAVKKVTEESEKAAAADLTTDEGFAAAIAAIESAASMLPSFVTKAAGAPAKPTETKTPLDPNSTDAKLGYQTKEAADQAAIAVSDGWRAWGADRGRTVSAYLHGLYDMYGRLKTAADNGELEAMMAQGGGAPGGSPEGAPPGPEEMAAAAPPGPDMGSPPGGGAPGGPDMGAGGPGGAGGMGGGMPSPDDLAAAFMEMGLQPEEVAAAAQKMKGDVAGQEAPEAEKAAAEAALCSVIKMAYDVKSHMRSGKFQLKPAADGSPERRSRETQKAYLRELLGTGN